MYGSIHQTLIFYQYHDVLSAQVRTEVKSLVLHTYQSSYIPLLLLPIPLSLSPVHLTVLLSVTYFLNRPCLYCSLLLIILFATSCHWSQRCLIDFSYVPISEGGSGYATWFIPRLETMDERSWNSTSGIVNSEHVVWAASWLAQRAMEGVGAATERLKRDTAASLSSGYILSFTEHVQELFRRGWVIRCLDTRIVL